MRVGGSFICMERRPKRRVLFRDALMKMRALKVGVRSAVASTLHINA